jgi:ribokinase
MKNTWVLGSSNMDLICHVDEMPVSGNTIQSGDLIQSTGGKGANQAYCISYWGIPVSFLGAVGDDTNGKTLVEKLRNSGVDVDSVRFIENCSSGTAIVMVNSRGENCIVVSPGANCRVPRGIFDEVTAKAGDFLIAQLEVNIDAVEQSFISASKRGVTTVLNPSPMKPLQAIKLRDSILRHTSVLVANSHEAAELGNERVFDLPSAEKCAKRLMKLGPKVVVITLGKTGSFLMSTGGSHFIEAIDVDVVDTQGAGDAFLGAFIARMVKEDDLSDCLDFANIVSSYSVGIHGSTQVSLPPKNDPYLAKWRQV